MERTNQKKRRYRPRSTSSEDSQHSELNHLKRRLKKLEAKRHKRYHSSRSSHGEKSPNYSCRLSDRSESRHPTNRDHRCGRPPQSKSRDERSSQSTSRGERSLRSTSRSERSPQSTSRGERSPQGTSRSEKSPPPSPLITAITSDEMDERYINNELAQEELGDETLLAIGEKVGNDENSFAIHKVIRNRWSLILSKGLEKTQKKVLLDNHQLPHNITLLKAPGINQEIIKAIPINTHNKDKFMQNNQNQLGKGISAIGKSINILLKDTGILDMEEKHRVLNQLSEAGKILTDVHYNMSITRRALITPTLSKTIMDVVKDAPVEELLFGSDLPEKLKAAKAIEKSAQDIKSVSKDAFKRPSSTQTVKLQSRDPKKYLNSRGPLNSRRESRQKGSYSRTPVVPTNRATLWKK